MYYDTQSTKSCLLLPCSPFDCKQDVKCGINEETQQEVTFLTFNQTKKYYLVLNFWRKGNLRTSKNPSG